MQFARFVPKGLGEVCLRAGQEKCLHSSNPTTARQFFFLTFVMKMFSLSSVFGEANHRLLNSAAESET